MWSVPSIRYRSHGDDDEDRDPSVSICHNNAGAPYLLQSHRDRPAAGSATKRPIFLPHWDSAHLLIYTLPCPVDEGSGSGEGDSWKFQSRSHATSWHERVLRASKPVI
jgi:hypothetical protein